MTGISPLLCEKTITYRLYLEILENILLVVKYLPDFHTNFWYKTLLLPNSLRLKTDVKNEYWARLLAGCKALVLLGVNPHLYACHLNLSCISHCWDADPVQVSSSGVPEENNIYSLTVKFHPWNWIIKGCSEREHHTAQLIVMLNPSVPHAA